MNLCICLVLPTNSSRYVWLTFPAERNFPLEGQLSLTFSSLTGGPTDLLDVGVLSKYREISKNVMYLSVKRISSQVVDTLKLMGVALGHD